MLPNLITLQQLLLLPLCPLIIIIIIYKLRAVSCQETLVEKWDQRLTIVFGPFGDEITIETGEINKYV